jgi:hypothetical protein
MHNESKAAQPEVTVPEIEDNGNVKIGGASPCFQPVKAPPRKIQDNGKVRIGGASPSI